MPTTTTPRLENDLIIARPPEGQMMAIMKGDGAADLDEIVASIKGHHFKYEEVSDDHEDPDVLERMTEWEKWEIVKNTPPFVPWPKGMLGEEGYIYSAPLRGLYIPQLRYSKWEKPLGADKTQAVLVSKDRTDSPFFYYVYNMAIPAINLEISGNITVNIVTNILVRVVNPYKMLFLSGGWESVIDAAIQALIRGYVGNKTFQKLREEQECQHEGLADQIKGLTSIAPSVPVPEQYELAVATAGNDPVREDAGLREKIGIEIYHAMFVQFDFSSKDPAVQAALTAPLIAEQQSLADIARAPGLKVLGEAEAEVARQKTAAYGSGEAAANVQATQELADAIRATKAEYIAINAPGAPPVLPPDKRKGSPGKGGGQK